MYTICKTDIKSKQRRMLNGIFLSFISGFNGLQSKLYNMYYMYKSTYRVKLKMVTLLSFFITFSQCGVDQEFQKIISETGNQYAPDSRTGVFSIKAEKKSSKLYLTGETDNSNAHKILIERLQSVGYEIADSIKILPGNIQKPWAFVSVSVANMRKEPSHEAEMVTQAFMGTPLKILKEGNGWLLVQTPDKYLSWIEEDVIYQYTTEDFKKWQNASRVVVTGWFDFLRDSVANSVVCDVTAGCILEYLSSAKDVVYVRTPDGRKGSLLKKNTVDFKSWKEEMKPQAEKILATAGSFLGTPYLWGGASIKGVDCSGFVRTVYFLNGCILSRDASQQALYGKEIEITPGYSFNPADLVFFGRPAKNGKPARVTHVGLFLGNTEFIHSSGLVRINSFDSTRANYSRYRTIGLLKVRRIIGSFNSQGITLVKNHPWY